MRYLSLFFLILVVAACSSSRSKVERRTPTYETNSSAPNFSDYSPVSWSGTRPSQYRVHGIDVSRYQNDINWRQVKSAGVSFAYIKATEGGDYLDPQFKTNWKYARKAGVRRGAYHFYYFCRTGAEQARWFIRNVPRERGALPPVLDMEWNHTSKTCKYRPNGATVRREMRDFIKIVTRHYGQKPVIYTTIDFYRENGLNALRGAEYWLRSVTAHPSKRYPGQRWSFWQYTGTGIVPGVRGETDINVFRGSPDQWRSWLAARAR